MRNKVKRNGLTETEERTLLFLKNGLSNKDMAEIENVSTRAIKYRLWVLFKKLGVKTRIQAIVEDKPPKARCTCGINKRIACFYHYGGNKA